MKNEHSVSSVQSELVTESSGKQTAALTEQIVLDEVFNYEGYQVVRGEFFSHIFEPSISFNNYKVYLNTACLKKFPDVNYVQILINPEARKLAVRPSTPDAKDSFLWCSANSVKRRPKQITCRIFFAKVFQLMGWNPDYRYKLLGKLIKSGDEHLFIFDLTSTEMYQRVTRGTRTTTSRTPLFPAEWKNQFGLPIEEHRKLLQVNIFKGYTVFGVNNNKPGMVNNTSNDSDGKELPL